jgi:hypothetical protein
VWKIKKKKKSSLDNDDYCLIVDEWGDFKSKQKELPDGPGAGNSSNINNSNADIITFNTNVLGGA